MLGVQALRATRFMSLNAPRIRRRRVVRGTLCPQGSSEREGHTFRPAAVLAGANLRQRSAATGKISSSGRIPARCADLAAFLVRLGRA